MKNNFVNSIIVNGTETQIQDYGRDQPNGVPVLDAQGKLPVKYIPDNELSNPVDVVQDGNMRAITSNAVADFAFDKSKIRIGYVLGGSANSDNWYATFDTPFTDSSYYVLVTPESSGGSCPSGWYTVQKTLSGFRLFCKGDAPNVGFHYMAIHV